MSGEPRVGGARDVLPSVKDVLEALGLSVLYLDLVVTTQSGGPRVGQSEELAAHPCDVATVGTALGAYGPSALCT